MRFKICKYFDIVLIFFLTKNSSLLHTTTKKKIFKIFNRWFLDIFIYYSKQLLFIQIIWVFNKYI